MIQHQERLSNEVVVACLKQEYDEKLFRHLLTRFEPLLRHLYQYYFVNQQRLYDYEDWYQEASWTLIKSIRHYQAGRGYFSAYYKLALKCRGENILRDQLSDKRVVQRHCLSLQLQDVALYEEHEYLVLATHCYDRRCMDPGDTVVIHETATYYYQSLSIWELEVLQAFLAGCDMRQFAVIAGKQLRSCQSALDRCRRKLIEYTEL